MKIHLLRHATLVVTLGDLTLLVDPMLSPAQAMEPVAHAGNQWRIPMVGLPLSPGKLQVLLEHIDAVLVTHTHPDHWDAAAQTLLPKQIPILCQPEDQGMIEQAGFSSVLPVQQRKEWQGLQLFRTEIKQAGYPEREMVVANGIGLLSQAYEATAGLIGNTLLTLARHREVYEQILTDPDLLPLVIQEVLRYDPSIQNTRRYLVSNGTVAGVEMKEGDGVLVVLAAANRDPAVNHAPSQFDLERPTRRVFTFGVGVHACPGEMLATIIARAGVEQLLHSGVNVSDLAESVSYRPSGNTRIPLFGGEKA